MTGRDRGSSGGSRGGSRGQGRGSGADQLAERRPETGVRVTGFFRDEEVWKALAARILPAITSRKRPGDAIRIWVPGCSTGEEAYSFGIVLAEHLGESLARYPIRIFATDTDAAALERARWSTFAGSIADQVSPGRLKRFFRQQGDAYEIAPEIRTLVLFAAHDVTADAPFSRVDLVSCRGLLVYLTPALQKRVLQTLERGLSPSGFLVLGAGETTGELPEPFSLVDARLRIYAKRAQPAERPEVLPASAEAATVDFAQPWRDPRVRASAFDGVEAPKSSYDFVDLHRQMLETIEGLECANEELQSTVEQLQCSNEELTATNDELQSARDALQATNEELSSTIDELGARSLQLRIAKDDVENILNAVGSAVVLVGMDGKIRRFNRGATDLCGLGPAQVGLPLALLAQPLGPRQLQEIVWRVVDQLVPFDEDVAASDGTRYAVRVVPYRTTEHAIRGAAITITKHATDKVSVAGREADVAFPPPRGFGSEPS